MKVFFMKLLLTGFSKQNKESIFVDILVKLNQLRNILTNAESSLFDRMSFFFLRWKTIVLLKNSSKSKRLKNIVRKLVCLINNKDCRNAFTQRTVLFRLWRNITSFTISEQSLIRLNLRAYVNVALIAEIQIGFERFDPDFKQNF